MVRNTVRLLIFQDGRLLAIKKERPEVGVYYTLPGGAQEPGETLAQTLKRECSEELGVEILESKFICIREYMSKNHEYSFIMKEVHAVEFLFECCKMAPQSGFRTTHADIGQIGIEWLPVETIKQSFLQTEERSERYKFPSTTTDFFVEYFGDGPVEPYKSYMFDIE